MDSYLQTLIQAVESSPAYDRLPLVLTAPQWQQLAAFLTRVELAAGQTLIAQGEHDRSVYVLASGSLSVHYEDAQGRVRLAMVGPGSVVGEGAFFSQLERSASVLAAGPTQLWLLSPQRWGLMCQQQPALALGLSQALGQVMAQRAVNKPKRATIT